MRNLCTFLLLFFTISFTTFGQAPGYLGKKASISLSLSSFPALFGPTQNNKGGGGYPFGEKSGWLGLNYEFEGNFNYVVGRYASLGLIVGQYYTGATSYAETLPINRDLSPPSSIFERDFHDFFLRVNVKSIGITYSKYFKDKGALAPVGNLFYYGIKRTFINSEIVDKSTDYYFSYGEQLGHRNLDIDETIAFHFVLFGWTNNQVFWDKLILKTGIRIGIPLELNYFAYAYSETATHPDYENNLNQGEYETQIFERLFRHEFMRFDIGVGYLLF